MVQRHHQIDFATGAMVFPGGKLEPGDRDPALRARAPRRRARSPTPSSRSAPAAIRETFEEARVLLARRRGAQELALRRRGARDRGAPPRGARGPRDPLAELARAEDLELACDLLVPFAHWITPEFMPKRFDTWFFLVDAPADQVAVHDGHESVDSLWITPGGRASPRPRPAGARSSSRRSST